MIKVKAILKDGFLEKKLLVESDKDYNIEGSNLLLGYRTFTIEKGEHVITVPFWRSFKVGDRLDPLFVIRKVYGI